MLALTRKIDETIIIGDDIEITIVEVNKNEVKLGIKAPKSIPIYRKELYDDMKKTNEEALKTTKLNLKDLL
ncbi:carbon storage regulator CsrA [Natranaerovirga hydrolytica]|uniref:Translational regulator CsrA n=1 Tax=Natranaerovirga hydrolytica TaxID=680378 RepID=A0A4R1MN75_9FIRM|nr:carbon storage regulator CsrA [Natranaerovirga hydrolytica]TCK93382.1 carbon storage regulator CsrA [Natranaerovirga hydrolytica]